MDQITKTLHSSKYSIHDLSRCRGEGDQNFARFNMPLELGIAMAQRFADDDAQSAHDWLLLVPEGHQYKKFISDISGYDPREYDLTKEAAVPIVMSWLATRPEAVRTPTPAEVLSVLGVFETRRKRLDDDWHHHTPWADVVLLAMDVVEECLLGPWEP